MTGDSRLLFTPEHAAAKLDVGRTTVYTLMASGELKSVKIGRSRRITADALREYVVRLEAGGQQFSTANAAGGPTAA
jgi:excisionase family DNA binding protein